MSLATATWIVNGILLYGLAGLGFSVYFYRFILSQRDPKMHQAHWSVKCLIFPAVVGLWPIVAWFAKNND